MSKSKIVQPSVMHVEIDFELTTESDGEIFTATPDIVFDQLKYVFERMKHKNIKITFKMVMVPGVNDPSTKKAGG